MKARPKLFLAAAFLCTQTIHAQLRLPLPTAFRNDVQKVVADFPSQFASLRGDVRITNPQTVEYASLLQVDKAEDCIITKYSSNTKPVYSLQALMLHTEDFSAAEKKYKWLFTQLKGMNVKYVVDQYTLQGVYEAPAEERKFTTSELALARPPQALQKLRVEVSMQYEFPEWKVALTIFEKEKDDEEEMGDTD
ncbi:MAG TPA: hypothetical protein VM010_00490 [Chitinophagaceae bacterium]|nr:hypothetical protein [Chitinophagaceae bacterium]